LKTRNITLTRTEIIEVLNRDVHSADARLTDARRIVIAIIAEAPTLPQPDGQHRITNAVRERDNARKALLLAVKRNCDFMLYGIVPKDLEEKQPQKPLDGDAESWMYEKQLIT
jgi:hypothetical protein